MIKDRKVLREPRSPFPERRKPENVAQIREDESRRTLDVMRKGLCVVSIAANEA